MATSVRAVGGVGIPPGYDKPGKQSDSVINALQAMQLSMSALEARLASPTLMIPIVFNNVPAGMALSAVSIPASGFNGVLMALKTGVVNMYLGNNVNSAVPDMIFTGQDNPIYIPLPPQQINSVTFKVDDNSTADAYGCLYVYNY